MNVQTKTNRLICVYVTYDKRLHTGTKWSLFANYPNEFEAHDAIARALGPDHDYSFAEIRITQVYEVKA